MIEQLEDDKTGSHPVDWIVRAVRGLLSLLYRADSTTLSVLKLNVNIGASCSVWLYV